MTIEETLQDRLKTHGEFREHAVVTQNLKDCVRPLTNWRKLSLSQREALDMIAHKIGRILAGNPNEPDHWHDIAGYASLVERELRENSHA